MSHTRTAPDPFQAVNDLGAGWATAMQQWWDQSQAAFAPWRDAFTVEPSAQAPRRHDHQCHDHDRGCGCGCGCQERDCDPCRCCVPDADVVVHAVAGEVRVVPFVLHNSWRRERSVTVAAGPWQVCDSDLDVRSVLDGEESLTLEPCESRTVRLVVSVRGRDDGDGDGGKRNQGGRGITDVASCASAYTDVRFEGCARPQRVAVVVHPAACRAVDLPCDCGCC